MVIFSKRLKEERVAMGLSQRTIAGMLNISQTTYMHYELLGTSNGREPSLDILVRIADILEVSVDYLLGREN